MIPSNLPPTSARVEHGRRRPDFAAGVLTALVLLVFITILHYALGGGPLAEYLPGLR